MFEKLFAGIMIIILSPFYLIISVLILLFSGNPILFKHKRCGYKFKDFIIFKFRTMSPNGGSEITNFADNRVTSIGRILRKYKLDELPQLLNVLRGDMHFIGPRPESTAIVNDYRKYFTYLNCQKPGIVDVCSIIFRDESSRITDLNMTKYAEEILPLKFELILATLNEQSIFKKIIVIIILFISMINYKLSLYIIEIFFLSKLRADLRSKLNNIFSIKIF